MLQVIFPCKYSIKQSLNTHHYKILIVCKEDQDSPVVCEEITQIVQWNFLSYSSKKFKIVCCYCGSYEGRLHVN